MHLHTLHMVPDTVDGRILYHLVFIKPYENMGYSPCQLVDLFHQLNFKQQIPQYLTRTLPNLAKIRCWISCRRFLTRVYVSQT